MRIKRVKKYTLAFTLVELLAVIIVLAVLGMVTIPIIQDLIISARRTAFKTTAYGYSKAMANKCSEKVLDLKNIGEDGATVANGDEFVFEYEISNHNYKVVDGKYVYEYEYTGTPQTFIAPLDGDYKIELWGASGEGSAYGAYTSGTINLKKGEVLYVYVGKKYNTGGNKEVFNNGTGNDGGYNGGGSTDVRLTYGRWDNFDSIKSRIMVAAGGGSGNTPGAGGGLEGYNGNGTGGGKQSTVGTTSFNYTKSSFGIANGGCTGGNGYYPGSGSTCASGAGGGSSFISGHIGCNAISESSTSSSITHTGSPNHYSKKVFTDTVMIDGKGREWTGTTAGSVVNMPTFDGASVMTGNRNDGYAKITVLTNASIEDNDVEVHEFKVPATGIYKLEAWGAQGGDTQSRAGGYGGYVAGEAVLEKNDILYIVVGGSGESSTKVGTLVEGGFNGGGSAVAHSENALGAASGGGATHIALNNNLGELKNYTDSKNDILMVAAGGGGGHYTNGSNCGIGGAGGGKIGGGPTSTCRDNGISGRLSSPGTLSGAGCASNNDYCGAFGQGGNIISSGSGGGAGWYGGSGAELGAGSGGSSYTSKKVYSTTMNMGVNSGNGHVKITAVDVSSPVGEKVFSVVSIDQEYKTEKTLEGYLSKNNADTFYGNSAANCDNEVAVYSRSLHLCAYKGLGSNEVELINNTEEDCVLELTAVGKNYSKYNTNQYITDSQGYSCENNQYITSTEDRYFTFDQATGTITGYSSEGPKDVVIPCKIGGVDVKTIGVSAFDGKGLNSVLMPDCITFIRANAFKNNNLFEVTIGSGVENIEVGAFANNKISEAIFPDNVRSIGNRYCSGQWASSCSQGSLFAGNPLKTVTFGKNLEYIEADTFNGLTSLIEANFAKSTKISTIGANAFINTKLTTLEINATEGNGVAIKGGAFANNLLEDLTLSGTIKEIGTDAFKNNQLPDSQAFIMCRNTDGTENNGLCSYAGANRSNVVIPDKVTNIDGATFDGLGLNGLLDTGAGLTSIRNWAFEGNQLTDVIIGDSVKSIYPSAFRNNKIVNLTLGDSVETIYLGAFENNKISTLVIPDSVKEIGAGGSYFSGDGCWSTGRAFISNPLESITFGSGLETIHGAGGCRGGGNFRDITTLTSVDFSKSTKLDSIGSDAFYNTRIASLSLPGSLTSLGSSSFASNSSLTELEIHSTSDAGLAIGSSVFANNSSLTSLTIDASGEGGISIGSSSFQNGIIEELTMTGKITSIASDAFKNNQLPDEDAFIMCRNSDGTENSTLCSYAGANRSNITIADNVTSLANASFSGLGLTGTLNTGNGVTDIETGKFEGNSLTNVIIGSSVQSIGHWAFLDNKITDLVIGDNVKYIYPSAFKNNKIANLTWGNSVEKIYISAFENNQLTTLVLPDSVKELGNAGGIFSGDGCSSSGRVFMNNPLTKVTLGSGIEIMYSPGGCRAGNGGVFADITTLTEVDFSRATKLREIGSYSFNNARITELTLPGAVTSLGTSAFANNPNLTELEINSTSDAGLSIGSSVFANNTSLTSLTLNATGTGGISIGASAFQNGVLEELTMTGKIKSIASDAFKNNQLPDEQAFVMCRNSDGTENSTLCSYAGANRSNITISDNVTSLANASFNGLGLTGTLNTGNGITAIEGSKFASNSLTTVIIGDAVTSIGGSAFASNQITSVQMGNAVISIGGSAFESNKIATMNLSENLQTIGMNAFNSNKLTTVSIPAGVKTIPGYAFSNNEISSLDLGHGVEYIHANAFRNNKIADLSIPNSVKEIGTRYCTCEWFSCCTAGNTFVDNPIETLTLGDSVSLINDSSFYGTKLSYVELPASVSTLGTNVFGNISTLDKIFVRGKVDETNFSSAGSGWNGSCSNVVYEYANCYLHEGNTITGYLSMCSKNIDIPSELDGNAITTIAPEAFKDIGLTFVSIPSSVSTIGEDAFAGNNIDPIYVHGKISEDDFTSAGSNWNDGAKVIYEENLQTCLKTSNNVLTGKYDLRACANYKNIVIPNTVTSIAANAFSGYVLDNITIVDGTRISSFGNNWNGTIYKPTFLGDSKEYNCYTLDGTTITNYKKFCPAIVDLSETIMGTTIDSIGANAFKNAAITDLTVTSNIITIGNNAFEGNSIEEIDFKEGLVTIGSEAFKNIGLTRVTVPGTVETIGANAFANNPRITQFYVNNKDSEADFRSVGNNWNGGHEVIYKGKGN